MFSFANPAYLYLLLLIPLAVLLFVWSRHSRKRRLNKYGKIATIGGLMPEVSKYKPWIKLTLSMLALAMVIVMLARPRAGAKTATTKVRGIEVMIALDVSNSMRASSTDDPQGVSRLQRAKLILEKLIDRLGEDKVGLIVFAGNAYTQLPITSDFLSAKMYLNSINTNMVPTQGTAIGAAINLAMKSFTQNEKSGKSIIIITDGENHEDDAIAAAKAAKDKGYDVLLINDQLGNHFVGLLEHKLEKSRFVRVDSDIVENLIVKEERKVSAMTPAERNIFSELFRCQIPHVDKTEFLVSFESLGSESQPVQITQSEYMRRMKEMAAMQPGMSFYGEMPDSYNLVLNTEHPVVKRLLDEAKASLNEKVSPIETAIDVENKAAQALREKKDATDDEKKQAAEHEAKAESLRNEENADIKTYADTVPAIRQIIDIALLGNNLLRGEDLDKFLRRSIDLLK